MCGKRRYSKAGYLLIVVSIVLPLWLGACEAAFPTRTEGGGIVRYPVPVSKIFNIGGKAQNGSNHGWLDDPDGDGVYQHMTTTNVINPNSNTVYHGVRLFNVDRELPPKERMDISEYDGVTFRYRTNMINTESRMLGCLFWWAWANEYDFGAWNYGGGFNNPKWIQNPANAAIDPNAGPDAEMYKEVIIPFYRMWKWGTPQPSSLVCNDTTRFNPNYFRNLRFDGRTRTSGSSEDYWLEIVDFAFFRYE